MKSEVRIAFAYRYGNYFKDSNRFQEVAEQEGFDIYGRTQQQAMDSETNARSLNVQNLAGAGRIALQAQTETTLLNQGL